MQWEKKVEPKRLHPEDILENSETGGAELRIPTMKRL